MRTRAHIEPVGRAVGDADEIALLADYGVDPAFGMQIEQTAAFDEEAHLELGVGVLVEELGAQGLAVGMVRRHAKDVDRAEAVLGHQTVDVAAIGGDDVVRRRIRRQDAVRLPALEIDAECAELAPDVGEIGEHRLGYRLVFGVNAQLAHRIMLLMRVSHSSRNSNASIRRRASATLLPQV